MEEYLTTSAAARLAGVHQTKLWNLARTGHCQEPMVIAGRAFWHRKEIEKLAKQLKAAEKAAAA